MLNPERTLLNTAVTMTKANERGVKNFQLKFNIWSMRNRGREYFTHMITK